MEREASVRMKWRDNMVRISLDGIVGKCPHCKSSNTDYVFVEHDDGRGYLSVWCVSCGQQAHIDCCSIPRNRKSISFKDALNLDEERVVALA